MAEVEEDPPSCGEAAAKILCQVIIDLKPTIIGVLMYELGSVLDQAYGQKLIGEGVYNMYRGETDCSEKICSQFLDAVCGQINVSDKVCDTFLEILCSIPSLESIAKKIISVWTVEIRKQHSSLQTLSNRWSCQGDHDVQTVAPTISSNLMFCFGDYHIANQGVLSSVSQTFGGDQSIHIKEGIEESFQHHACDSIHCSSILVCGSKNLSSSD